MVLQTTESVRTRQFPLLPLEETLSIAAECGVAHPCERKTEERHPVVMTSDFLITLGREQGGVDQALTGKYTRRLSDERVLEKFEIERRYWERRGISWTIVTERDLPTDLARNVELIRGRRDITDRLPLTPEQLYEVATELTDRVVNDNLSLQMVTSACDVQFDLPTGGALTIVHYLLANRYWEVDMYRRIDPGQRLIVIRHFIGKLDPANGRNL